jgi:hypothetical protein
MNLNEEEKMLIKQKISKIYYTIKGSNNNKNVGQILDGEEFLKQLSYIEHRLNYMLEVRTSLT